MLGFETHAIKLYYYSHWSPIRRAGTNHTSNMYPPHISLYQIYIVVVSYNVKKSCTLKVFKFNKIKFENGKRSSRVPESSLLK